MQYTIAHISKPGSKQNKSYKNYYIEKTKISIHDNMKWDDNEKNKLNIGDFFFFYCWGKRVELHRIIDITDWMTRPLHWDISTSNVLHLSPCLKSYSFAQFGIYDPPYKIYKQGFRPKCAYELNKYPKLKNELIVPTEFDISIERIHHSELIKNHYNAVVDEDNSYDTTGFMSMAYRSLCHACEYTSFKKQLYYSTEDICRLIKENEYNHKSALYNCCKVVLDDYIKIGLEYCIGGEGEFENPLALNDAINLFCVDSVKAISMYGSPNGWGCSEKCENWGNSYTFTN